MDNESNRKKTVKDINLAPTKGVRKPGAARMQTQTQAKPQSDAPAFKRAAAPVQSVKQSPKQSLKQPAKELAGDDYFKRPISRTSGAAGSGIRKPGQTVRRNNPNFTGDLADPQQSTGDTSKVSLRTRKTWNSRIKNTSSAPKVIITALIMVAIVFFSAFLSYTYLVDKYSNPVTLDSIVINQDTAVSFKIERNSGTDDIARNLKEQGLIGSKFIYKFLSKFNGYDGQYKAGTYTLCKDLTYDEIMVILSSNPESVKITIPEGFTTEQIAARLEANGVCTAKSFLNAVEKQDLTSYSFITKHDGRDYRLDGYLFPDTYEFDIDASPESIIYKLLNRFNDIYTPEYAEKAAAIGLSQDQVIILASLVEKEARLASEQTKIAGVFINRLNSSSYPKLQSCATVKYSYARLYGQTLDTVTKEHTTLSYPYNTYANEGLPPGPICNPGKAAIEAVLNYAHHDYYFFVAKTDGSNGHTFTRTYAEHVAAQGF